MIVDNTNMFSLITSVWNIEEAFKLASHGKHAFKKDAIQFIREKQLNLFTLRYELLTGTYKPSKYRHANIEDTKKRSIFIPAFRDKIVQHAVNLVLREYYEPKYIYDSYACIREKGNDKAVKRLRHMYRSAYNKFNKEVYLLKLDVSKFFYSIDKPTLVKVLNKRITCKPTLRLLETIIYSHQPEQPGLPLGNLTSQQFANILLNELDQHMKYVHNLKYYLRYADDIFIFLPNKSLAKHYLMYISKWTKDNLKLTINPVKMYIQDLIKKPFFTGLGFNISKEKILLTRHIKFRFKYQLRKGTIEAINSVFSHMRTASCDTWVRSVLPNHLHIVKNSILIKKYDYI